MPFIIDSKYCIHFNRSNANFSIFFPLYPFHSILERKYQCLGQWTENNIIYTYAKRLDVPIYECFLGALASTEEIFIKEAGEHCRRDIDPYRYSMQLNKTRACPHKMDLPPIVTHDVVLTSSTPTSSIETTLSNGEVEYEYYEENHPSMNGNGNILSSTESKGLTSQSPKYGLTVTENQSANGEKTNYDLFHPSVHPKLDAGTAIKTDNKNNITHNRSNCSAHILISNVLLLALLLPLFNR